MFIKLNKSIIWHPGPSAGLLPRRSNPCAYPYIPQTAPSDTCGIHSSHKDLSGEASPPPPSEGSESLNSCSISSQLPPQPPRLNKICRTITRSSISCRYSSHHFCLSCYHGSVLSVFYILSFLLKKATTFLDTHTLIKRKTRGVRNVRPEFFHLDSILL